jgi:uncharacterized protein YjdB
MGRRVKTAFLSKAILILLFVGLAAGCGGSLISTITDITNEDYVASDKADLEIAYTGGNSASEVTGNIILPKSGPNGTTIAWSCTKPDIVSPDGVVVRPAITTEVTLTATISMAGSAQTTKVFKLTVLQMPVSETPAAPGAPTLTAGEAQLSVSWTAVQGASSYELYWAESNDPAAAETAQAASSSPATITGLLGGRPYFVWIKAVNGIGKSDFSPSASGTPMEATVIAVAGVSLDKTKAGVAIGASLNLNAIFEPDDATNKGVSWVSSASGVASVTASGQVTGVSAGTATITVKTDEGGKTASCEVTVTVPVVSVSVKSSTSLIVGATEKLQVTFDPANASNKNVNWAIQDQAVATVASDGTVTAVGVGTTSITVTTEDGSKTASCTVSVANEVIPVTAVGLNKTSTKIVMGASGLTYSEQLTPSFTPSNATNQNVNWSSSNTAVAQVYSGLVIAVAPGTTTITVTSVDGSRVAFCTVTVTQLVTSVSLGSTASVAFGSTLQLSATTSPANATNSGLTWQSSAPLVASVNSSGLVSGVSAVPGTNTATTTATAADGGGMAATCTVTVTQISPTLGSFPALTKNFGAGFTLTAPNSTSTGSFTYASSNTGVATVVSGTGVVTLVAAGTSTITATQVASGNYTAGSIDALLTVNAVLPVLTTTAASNIHATYATSGGNITSGGGAAVTARGICWGTSANPTTNPTSDGTGTGAFSSSLASLAVGTTYYIRAYATNGMGTAYGSQVAFQAVYGLGDSYAGGIVYSISGTYPNQHGLVATAANLTSGVWSYSGFLANADSLTDGATNTANIVAFEGATHSYAAKTCADCRDGGYADWYLPAYNELATLGSMRSVVGNWPSGDYWSSTQWGQGYAHTWNLGDTGLWYTNICRVRAIRKF